jgi:hypothetical protein
MHGIIILWKNFFWQRKFRYYHITKSNSSKYQIKYSTNQKGDPEEKYYHYNQKYSKGCKKRNLLEIINLISITFKIKYFIFESYNSGLENDNVNASIVVYVAKSRQINIRAKNWHSFLLFIISTHYIATIPSINLMFLNYIFGEN